MQGVVIDEERKYVKAAVVKVFRMQDLSDDSDTEVKAITYTWTDQNGRFVIRDLDPDEDYTIEIHVENTVENLREEPAEIEVEEPAGIEVEDITEISEVEETAEIDVVDTAVEYPAEIEVEEPAVEYTAENHAED
ncbi:MAG: hypothetical protein AAGU75_21230, partial [Bacillota bacterium]